MEHLLTLEEVADMFAISEQKVIELAEKGVIPSYKLAGVHLRFKAEQIEAAKDKITKAVFHEREQELVKTKASFKDGILDFFYFYDYYLFMAVVICMLIYWVLKG